MDIALIISSHLQFDLIEMYLLIKIEMYLCFDWSIGFPLAKMNGDFAAKFIWACTFLFVYSLAGEFFLFKIIKIDVTNSRQKNLPHLLDQSKHNYISIFALSANTFQSDQIEDGC